jgi:transcriptional antiterminator
MFREECVQQLRDVHLSNNTVSRRIADISEDLDEQSIEKVRRESFSVQIGEATDRCGIGHLMY